MNADEAARIDATLRTEDQVRITREQLARLERTAEAVQHLAYEGKRLRGQINVVRALHIATSYGPYCDECSHGCGGGDVDWPCPTLLALGGPQ